MGDAGTSRPAHVYPILIIGVLSFSSSPILVRYAADAPALAVAVWRTVLAATFLAPIAIPHAAREVRRLSIKDIWLIVLAGVLLSLHFVTWIESLYHTSVASASVLVTTSPLFLAILGFVLLRERLSMPVVGALVLAVGGAALIGIGDAGPSAGPRAPLGNSLALFAALLVSFYLLIGRVVRQKVSWMAYLFPLYSVVALTTLGLALALGAPIVGYHAGFYGLCALMALFPQIIGHGSFNYAVRYLPAALLGLLSLVEPVGASIAAYFLFDEVPSPLSITGIVVVLTAVSFAVLYRRRRELPGMKKASSGSSEKVRLRRRK